MKISARNQLEGKIIRIQKGAVNTEVCLEIGNEKITAIITNSSCQNLALQEGANAVAIIKASSVLIGLGEFKISARNQFSGTIESIQRGTVNAEVRIKVGTQTITSIITLNALSDLNLKEDDEVKVIVKASNILIGIR
ncbi:hypothetical protein CCZ01_02705 [Helicobacter monodelphidis]|uniref:TOBE domain-containing protein n=1 Tax=Helicobacter sp. 15-1451 TaxID=2004995 RepID=UPI000DCB7198|nr:TOBE domain-containing protein [Helicobacter sp. 15-1451]RAX58345.1 hypothetical protein CCZ01_02705 [Helicobacter sp. 15-1451]